MISVNCLTKCSFIIPTKRRNRDAAKQFGSGPAIHCQTGSHDIERNDRVTKNPDGKEKSEHKFFEEKR